MGGEAAARAAARAARRARRAGGLAPRRRPRRPSLRPRRPLLTRTLTRRAPRRGKTAGGQRPAQRASPIRRRRGRWPRPRLGGGSAASYPRPSAGRLRGTGPSAGQARDAQPPSRTPHELGSGQAMRRLRCAWGQGREGARRGGLACQAQPPRGARARGDEAVELVLVEPSVQQPGAVGLLRRDRPAGHLAQHLPYRYTPSHTVTHAVTRRHTHRHTPSHTPSHTAAHLTCLSERARASAMPPRSCSKEERSSRVVALSVDDDA